MRKLFHLPAVVVIFAYLVMSCGPSRSEFDNLIIENASLKAEISRLTTTLDACNAELEQYKNSPDILFAEAQKCVENKDAVGLNTICTKLEKYHPSSPECQRARASFTKLIQEKERAEAAEKAKRMRSVNKLRKEYDDVSGITWYYNPYFKHYTNSNLVSVYMGRIGIGKPWLRLRMSYYGDGWIFFEKAYLSYDGNTIEIPFDKYEDKKTENDSSCWEWIDVGVNDKTLRFLQAMIDGKSVKMRLSGKYTETHTLSKNEIAGIRDVLLAYDVLLRGE